MVGQKPIAKVNGPQGVSAALWENEISVGGRSKTIVKVSVSKRYKDSSGQFRSAASFSVSEVPAVIFCLFQAYQKMVGEESGQEPEATAVEEEVVM